MRQAAKNTAGVLAVILGLIISIEGILYLGWRVTQSTKLGTLYQNSIHWRKDRAANLRYPKYPERFFKVAVFGGSSSAGNSSEANFANILDYELGKALAFGKPIYVRNYAIPGAAFHKNQAELAKIAARYYDVLVVYAGNNEWVNYYFTNKGFPSIGVTIDEDLEASNRARAAAVRAELEGRFSLFDFLQEYSRIYSVLWKISVKSFGKFHALLPNDHGLFSSRAKRPSMTESHKLVPEPEIKLMIKNFEQSLMDVAAEADRHGAALVAVPAVGNELFPPYFSAGASDQALIDALKKAERAFLRNDFNAVGVQADAALESHPLHSFANYVKGIAELNMGRFKSAWSHLTRAVEEDGFPYRSPQAIEKAVHAAKSRFSGMFVVDFPETSRHLIEEKPERNALFDDQIHPNLSGHALIARMVLCVLRDYPALRRPNQKDYCAPLRLAELQEITDIYRRSLAITDEESLDEHRRNQKGFFVLSRISAHPYLFYLFAERYLPLAYGARAPSPSARAAIQFWSGVYAAMREEDCSTIESRLDDARKTASDVFSALKLESFIAPGFASPFESVSSHCPNLTAMMGAQ